MPDPGSVLDGETPRHGYQGDRPEVVVGPARLTIAVSREAGARGTSIARRVGERLGWQVYSQDLIEYMTHDEGAKAQLLSELPPDAAEWADRGVARLKADGMVRSDDGLGELPRLLLMLASRGAVIIVGRGAGYLLPPESTLHVRMVSPLPARIAYLAQLMRLTREQAAEEVRRRDQKRAEFLATSFRRPPAEAHAFDLTLNSGRLGEELCSELIVAALSGKESARPADSDGE